MKRIKPTIKRNGIIFGSASKEVYRIEVELCQSYLHSIRREHILKGLEDVDVLGKRQNQVHHRVNFIPPCDKSLMLPSNACQQLIDHLVIWRK